MAKIVNHSASYGDVRGFNIETQGPTGSFPARLIDIEDNFNVDVQKYGGAIGEMEKKDTTEFLFAYNSEGQTFLVKSWEMTQSGGERSALYKLLSNMKVKLQSSMAITIIVMKSVKLAKLLLLLRCQKRGVVITTLPLFHLCFLSFGIKLQNLKM